MEFLSNRAITFSVPFEKGTDFFTPDVGTVSFTVRDNTGQPIDGLTDVAVTTTSSTTRLDIALSAEQTSISGLLENRYVEVRYESRGLAGVINTSFRLRPFVPMSVTGDEVRSFLGLTEHELGDDEMEFYWGYLRAKMDVPAVDAALVAGDMTTLLVNDMIKGAVVIKLIASLPLRVAKSEQSEASQFARLDALIDFKALLAAAQDLYQKGVTALGVPPLVPNYPLFMATGPAVDPIRGDPWNFKIFVSAFTSIF